LGADVPEAWLKPSDKKTLKEMEDEHSLKMRLNKQEREATPPKPSDVRGFTKDVLKDPDVDDFITVRSSFRTMQSLANQGSGPADLGLIFSYMKVLDPGSVVRESEYRNAAEAVGKIEALKTLPKKFIKGEKLTKEGRQFFIDSATALVESRRQAFGVAIDFYKRQHNQELPKAGSKEREELLGLLGSLMTLSWWKTNA
jgi:hypothetical protein